jgi:hypothetical protein
MVGRIPVVSWSREDSFNKAGREHGLGPALSGMHVPTTPRKGMLAQESPIAAVWLTCGSKPRDRCFERLARLSQSITCFQIPQAPIE